MRKTTILTLAAVVLLSSVVSQRARADGIDEDFESFGDVVQIALPATGITLAVLKGDKDGQWMWAKSLATQIGTIGVIKLVVDKTRPTAGEHSYPSGHTAAAFMGASFLQRRYGWWWGVPAYGLAGVVGYSRMHAEKHDWWDVAGGATIGIFSTYIWTTPYRVGDTAVKITPAVGEDYYGLDFNLTEVTQHTKYKNLFSTSTSLSTGTLTPTGQISTGTDPTEIRTRLELSATTVDQSQEVKLSARRCTGYLFDVGFDWAFAEHHQVGVLGGWVSNQLEDFSGFGDTILGYRWRFHLAPEVPWWQPRAAAVGVDSLVPTGDGDRGTGNEMWIVRPVLYGSWTLADNAWGMNGSVNFYPSVGFYQSFCERAQAEEIRDFAFETTFEYKFNNGIYGLWAPEFVIEKDGRDAANHHFELGVPLSEDFLVFVGYDLVGNQNWKLNPPGRVSTTTLPPPVCVGCSRDRRDERSPVSECTRDTHAHLRRRNRGGAET